MSLAGKGFMIWKVKDCEGGNPSQIASVAQSAGLTHVLIKIADGIGTYNEDRARGIDLVAPVAQALRQKGMQVWGWHYVYGYNPAAEAQIAVKRCKQLALDGYVIDAEVEYKVPGAEEKAKVFMTELRKGIPNLPVALCSFRFPSYHPTFPWKVFLEKCDYNMPQVYWEKAHNAGEQLRRSVRELQSLTPIRPVVPTGPVYNTADWAPAAAEIADFLNTARSLNLAAVNFFSWEYGRSNLKALWNTIANFNWGGSNPQPVPQDITEAYIAALNARNPSEVAKLFHDNAIRITASLSIQGNDAIKAWYTIFLNQTLPNATFRLTSSSGSGNSRYFTWQATSPKGKITNGNDTFGLLDGKISYHYTFFTITSS
ncbi:MAG: nuclear transport factor 2 family protein [Anaerolineae bacterium]|nr:nuclear transport factor 2 family protein [Anaerolineae bacterium]